MKEVEKMKNSKYTKEFRDEMPKIRVYATKYLTILAVCLTIM